MLCTLKLVLRAINQTRGTVLCAQVEEATTAVERGRGLIGRTGLAPRCGILIGCGPLLSIMWIHTFFMRFPIDIVFLDRGNRIMRVSSGVKPWRLTAPVFGAHRVLEIEAGAAARNSSRPGIKSRSNRKSRR